MAPAPCCGVNHSTTRWNGNYSETPGKKGLLDGIVLKEGENVIQSIAYDYEQYNRLDSKTETILGTPYTTSYTYDDEIGFPLRLKATTYPTGYTMTRDYDALTGRLRQLKHGSTVLWTTESMNALGQITRYTTGNGAVTDIAYDERHLMENQTTTASGGNILQNFSYDYDIFANLAARKDNKRNLEETFTYDHLNRLTDIWLNDVHTGHMAYDALGRMTDKRTDGQQVFSSAQHDYVGPDGQLRPHAVSSAQTGDGFPQAGIQSIDYTMFDKVSTMTYNGSNHYVFEYGYDHQRTRMTATNGGILMVNKDYVGSCEFVRHAASPQLSFTYLSGPMGVFAMVEKEGATEQVQYILKDHLGSYTAITDDDGELVLQQSFDAWGNRRNPSTWTGNAAALNFHDRGFTGHEHLFGMVGGIYKKIGLINMNGRMYDPVMSTFLSVDNYVQSPENSQNFNRYAYCLNNPLRYTDPDGEWFLTFGLDYGKNSNGNFGVTGLSLGINFGTFGFGTHFNWGNGFTAGLYGEVGPHIGCAGVNATLGFDYNFTYGTSTLSLSGGYGASYGIGRASLGGNVSYTFGLPQGVSGFNANIMAGLGLAGNINKYGQQAGFGLSASYGTQGFGFGAHTYCEMIPLQEKLDRIVKYYEAELSEQFGDAGVGNVYAGTKRNLRNTKRLSLDGPFLVDENGRHAYGAHVPGNALEEQIEIDGILCKRMKDNDIYISKRTIQEIWHGNDVAVETLFHEWQHSSDYYSGCADYYFRYYGMSNEACSNWLEFNAYSLNYSRCPTQRYYNRVVKYNDAIDYWNRIYGN